MTNTNIIRIALFHMAPINGDLEYNMFQLKKAINIAGDHCVDWLITPELALSGYSFQNRIGTCWINPIPNIFTEELSILAYENNLTCFIGMPEKSYFNNNLYNSLVIIPSNREPVESYRKIHVVDVPSEHWSSPGQNSLVKTINEIPIGFLICADSYWPDVALEGKDLGVKLLLSIAAWPPGQCGPNGEWELRSKETGLPLLCCNRTGYETDMDFSKGESVVVVNGTRLYTFKSPKSTIFIVDMSLDCMNFSYAGAIFL